jgi:hypothetical protein
MAQKKQLKIQLSDLIPLDASVSVDCSIKQRPYISISLADYEFLISHQEVKYYETPSGQIVMYDVADGGYALIPLKNQKRI